MKTASCKAKGRRLAQEIKDLLLKYAPDITDRDIQVTPSGVTGPDLHLSAHADTKFPFVIECKNQEKLNIWNALSQLDKHDGWGTKVLFFRRNKSKTYVTLEAEEFLKLVS
jgi:hypothetical protein